MANEYAYLPSHLYLQYDGSVSGDLSGAALLGESDAAAGVYYDAAFRFTGVAIAQGTSVYEATLSFYTSEKGVGTGKVKCNLYGIDEDNTSAFTSNPFGRAQTTATGAHSEDMPAVGAYMNFNVKNQVDEILARAGWASGNAMGFLLFDNTSDTDANIGDSDFLSRLVIRTEAEPDFTPAPQTISAPTLPTPGDYGIKIARPGASVLSALDAELFFSTKRKAVKIVTEAEASCTATVTKTIPHGLSYIPCVMGFVKGNTYRFKLNRDFDGATDPVGGGVIGYIWADTTNIYIQVSATTTVYYYVFVDELAEV